MSGSGISWVIGKSAPRSRQITTPAPNTQFLWAGCPSCRPTNSAKALKALTVSIQHRQIQEVEKSRSRRRTSDAGHSAHLSATTDRCRLAAVRPGVVVVITHSLGHGSRRHALSRRSAPHTPLNARRCRLHHRTTSVRSHRRNRLQQTNERSKNFDERPHRPSTRHPRDGESSIPQPRFRRPSRAVTADKSTVGLPPVPDFPGCPGFVPCGSASQQDQPRDAKCSGFQGMLVTKQR